MKTNHELLTDIEDILKETLDIIPTPPPGRGLAIVRTALENVLALAQFYRRHTND